MSWEYRVVPAPRRVPRVKGLRAVPDRFAHAVAEVMNEAGREGWEFLRADALPMEPAAGLFGGVFGRAAEVTQTLLVFRRPLARAGAPADALDEPHAAAAGVPAPEPVFRAPPAEHGGGGRVMPLPPRAARPVDDAPSAEALGGSLTPGPPEGPHGGPPNGPAGGPPPRLGGARRD